MSGSMANSIPAKFSIAIAAPIQKNTLTHQAVRELNSGERSMPIRVKCGNCKQMLKVKDTLAGKAIKCPVCQGSVAVPLTSPEKPGPAGQPVAAKKKPVPAGKPGSGAAPSANSALEARNAFPMPAAKTPPPDLPPENVDELALEAFSDEPAPVEEAPTTIDFNCPWCDEALHLPVEMGGKQSHCTNEDCRRIIKVPMPKMPEKKDWRKMDRPGSAMLKINQPEQLANAWGSEETTHAHQAALVEAGAVAAPSQPGIGVAGWLRRGFYLCCLLAVGYFVVTSANRVRVENNQNEVVKRLDAMVDGVADPLLRAETHRTIALFALQDGLAIEFGSPAFMSQTHFQGASSLIPKDAADKGAGINEQLFLAALAPSQIELGGDEDEAIRKLKIPWAELLQKDIKATLEKIKIPEVQVMAVREVVNRLLEKKLDSLAIGLTVSLSNDDPNGKRPAVFAQQIALLYSLDQAEALKKLPKMPDLAAEELAEGPERVGYAEGCARKGKFDDAFKLAKIKGPPQDRLETCVGVAAIALSDRKTKDQALRFIQEGMEIVKAEKLSPWLRLQLVQLAAQTQESDKLKDLIAGLPEPFKLRAELELFFAQCDKSPAAASPNKLAPIEAADKEGTTLGLAWIALARHLARQGAKLPAIQKTFAEHVGSAIPPHPAAESIRPLVDVGAYQGTLKNP